MYTGLLAGPDPGEPTATFGGPSLGMNRGQGYSRYLLRYHGLCHPDGERVRRLMEATVREYGLRAVRRSDNGPLFATLAVHGLSSLAVS